MTDIYLNNKLIGEVDDPVSFLAQVKGDRRKGALTSNLNLFYDENTDEVRLETGKGRARRPLVIVKEGIPLLNEKHIKQLEKGEISWNDLLQQGVIEFLDAAEEENAFVAFSEKDLTMEHTHLEISPLVMLGLATSLVPFSNHSPPTRINMGSKNQKQALGFYASNFLIRMDMDVNLLQTPQLPVAQSSMHDIYNNLDDEVARYIEDFKSLNHGTIGFIGSAGDRILGCDLFHNTQTYRKFEQKLIRSYALDAIEYRQRRGNRPETKQFLDSIINALQKRTRKGQPHIHFKGTGFFGQTLLHNKTFVHMSVFPA